MGKVFSRKVISTAVAGSLLFGAGSAVVTATPKAESKQTGLTVQNVQTGVITINEVTVPSNAREVQLTGTVAIDGPQLVVLIHGAKKTTVTNISDKVWTFEAVVDVSSIKADAVIDIAAYTVFTNGRNVGKIHTMAPAVSQKIHVPFIKSTVAENFKWEYNQSNNQFKLSYDEIEDWSVGKDVVTAKSLFVNGKSTDLTLHGTKVKVPTANQDFTFSPEATWSFDASTQRYSATFTIFITDSKGAVRREVVTRTGLLPGQLHEIPHSVTDKFGTITKKASYTAPAAPVGVVVNKLKNLVFTPVQQNKNQFKVEASYEIVYSDGTIEAKKHYLEGNFGNPKSKSKNPSTRNWQIGDFTYKITVHYNAKNKKYYVTHEDVSKK